MAGNGIGRRDTVSEPLRSMNYAKHSANLEHQHRWHCRIGRIVPHSKDKRTMIAKARTAAGNVHYGAPIWYSGSDVY